MTHVAIFENVIMYMPVADDTLGGTPIANRSGLKITPPPSPRAPATHPPQNPRTSTFLSVLPSNTKSLLDRLIFPYFCFNFYCFDTSLTAMTTMENITAKNTTKKIQSAVLHLLKPIVPVEPLRRLWSKRQSKLIRLRPYLPHWP
jgi:hypothetical protein